MLDYQHFFQQTMFSMRNNLAFETNTQGCNSGKLACEVFLDFQKAFNTVNHDILLKKLEYYGIHDKSNKWFRSFLEDRKQHTAINRAKSFDKPISIGVPQGSILGPILFILFINDLHKAVEFSSMHHFADDTNLLLTEKSLKKLNKHINRDLKLVVQWIPTCRKNKDCYFQIKK